MVDCYALADLVVWFLIVFSIGFGFGFCLLAVLAGYFVPDETRGKQ